MEFISPGGIAVIHLAKCEDLKESMPERDQSQRSQFCAVAACACAELSEQKRIMPAMVDLFGGGRAGQSSRNSVLKSLKKRAWELSRDGH